MTWESLADVIQFNLDGDLGRERLAHCWAPRATMEKWFDKRRLPRSPALFLPPAETEAEPASAAVEFGSKEHKRQAVDAAIEKFGVQTLARMRQKTREQEIIGFVESKHSGLLVSDRFVRSRLSDARKDGKERNRS
jgi:hypothetical protein